MKKKNLIYVATILVFELVITSVYADTRVIGGGANLSKGQSITYTMDNTQYRYFFGSAKANITPTSGTKIRWVMKKKGLFGSKIAEDYIVGLNTSSYRHTAIFDYNVSGNYNNVYTAIDGAYNGNVQTTNSTDSYIGF